MHIFFLSLEKLLLLVFWNLVIGTNNIGEELLRISIPLSTVPYVQYNCTVSVKAFSKIFKYAF